MAKSKKIIIAAVTLILAVAVIFFARWLIRYYFYNDYREYISSYEYEEGTAFQALQDGGGEVAGMELAAENDILKLYADTETAEVAVVDKRNGQIAYSNPMDADDDAIASTTNKNYLKSQLILDYFNTSRTEGTFDSFSYCTSRGSWKRSQFRTVSVLSIHWGIWRARLASCHSISAGQHWTGCLRRWMKTASSLLGRSMWRARSGRTISNYSPVR